MMSIGRLDTDLMVMPRFTDVGPIRPGEVKDAKVRALIFPDGKHPRSTHPFTLLELVYTRTGKFDPQLPLQICRALSGTAHYASRMRAACFVMMQTYPGCLPSCTRSRILCGV